MTMISVSTMISALNIFLVFERKMLVFDQNLHVNFFGCNFEMFTFITYVKLKVYVKNTSKKGVNFRNY